MGSSLKDKVVLITGASSGIGRGTAILFASLGSKLVICGRDADELQATAELCTGAGEILQVVGDLTDEAYTEGLVKQTIEHYKQLDVLVNNAGKFSGGNIDSPDGIQILDDMMTVNVRTVYQLTMLAVPHLIATKGSIVNVSTVYSLRAFDFCMQYGMSKAAINHFTECLALQLAPKGVRVNSVNPGLVRTKIVDRALKPQGLTDEQIENFLQKMVAPYPISRFCSIEEVAKAIVFLAGSDSSFTTGLQIPLAGGLNLGCAK